MIDKKLIPFLICQSNDSLIGNSLSLLEAQNKDLGVVSHTLLIKMKLHLQCRLFKTLSEKSLLTIIALHLNLHFSLDDEALSSTSVSSSAQFISAKSLRLWRVSQEWRSETSSFSR